MSSSAPELDLEAIAVAVATVVFAAAAVVIFAVKGTVQAATAEAV